MIDVRIFTTAQDHLDALWKTDEDAAAEIETALEEIAQDQRLAERLDRKKFRNIGTPSIEVDVFEELFKRGYNL